MGMEPSVLGVYPLGMAYTKRFLFLMMLKRRDWAKSVTESNSDLNKE